MLYGYRASDKESMAYIFGRLHLRLVVGALALMSDWRPEAYLLLALSQIQSLRSK